jgi:hypothetical protein
MVMNRGALPLLSPQIRHYLPFLQFLNLLSIGAQDGKVNNMLTFLGSRGFGELTLCQLPFCQLPTFIPVGLISETEITRRSGQKKLTPVDVFEHLVLVLATSTCTRRGSWFRFGSGFATGKPATGNFSTCLQPLLA